MEIKYYENKRGDREIFEFIKNEVKDEKHQIAIIKRIDTLETGNFQRLLETKVVEKIKGNKNIYELKCRYGNNLTRILFGIINNYAYLALIFAKKDQKILKKYIDKAIIRINKRELYESQRIKK